MEHYLENHSGEVMILILATLLLGTLLVLVPKLLRSHHHILEMQHEEHMKALDQGQLLPPLDERSRAAGRTAALVPMVVICAASTVTCFLVAYKSDDLFAVSLAVWSVAGIVGLAAITGGVALMGRLAQLQEGDLDEEPPENPLMKS
jgi:hypothetical protein